MYDLKNLKSLLHNSESLFLKMIDGHELLNKYAMLGYSIFSMHLCHKRGKYMDFFTYGNSLDGYEGIIFKLLSVYFYYVGDVKHDNINYIKPMEILNQKNIKDLYQYELDKNR